MQNTPWWAALLLALNIIMLFIGLKLLRRQPEGAQGTAEAVTAAIAEYEGTDISALRVVSFNRRRQA